MSDPRTELRDRIAAALADRFTGRAGPLVGDTYVAFADVVMELFADVRPSPWLRAGYVIAELAERSPSTESGMSDDREMFIPATGVSRSRALELAGWYDNNLVVQALKEAEYERGVAAGRRQAAEAIAEKLRLGAAGRRQYAATVPVKDELLLQAHTLDGAAQVAKGDDGQLYAWVPSWMWTEEMHDRVAEAAPAEPVEEAP